MKNDLQTAAPATPAHGVFAGTSGWAYSSWKPRFYPREVPAKRFLGYYATRLNSVEVNYTFRRTPSLAVVEDWLAQTGPDFRFSFKAPQRITHMRRLKDCTEPLQFFYEAIEPVVRANRLGLILFQLPPNFKADAERLDGFLRNAREAGPRLRPAFEFRHESWFAPEIYKVLERHGAALCIAESDEMTTPEIATAAFSCYRMRKSSYSQAALAAAAARILKRVERGDVFVYFKHEDTPEGALHAEALLRDWEHL